MTPAVVFRCNVSASVGIGHLMRCREMARCLDDRGFVCCILGPPESLKQEDDKNLFAHWEPIGDRGSSAQDANRVIQLCRGFDTRYLVMDDYRADPDYQLLLKRAGLRWLQQFDASELWDFHADLLVNASPYERREHYLPFLKNAATRTLFGPRYAVIRPAFSNLATRTDGRPVRRILVAFGGGDDLGAIDLTLAALAGRLGQDVTLVVVSGRANPRGNAVATRVANLRAGQVEFHIDPPDMPGLMASCDLAVIGGGTMSYEAAICGLPMVFITLAPNQVRTCQGWHGLTGAIILGQAEQVAADTLHNAVVDLVQDDKQRRDMAIRGRAHVDGKGTARLVDALLETEFS